MGRWYELVIFYAVIGIIVVYAYEIVMKAIRDRDRERADKLTDPETPKWIAALLGEGDGR